MIAHTKETKLTTNASNRNVPPNQAVYVHDTALPSFKMMQRDGSLRGDLRASLSIAGSAAALYHHEPHMGRVEYQVWVNYGTTRPSYLGLHDGVPIVWVYLRPLVPVGESPTQVRRPAPGVRSTPKSNEEVPRGHQ